MIQYKGLGVTVGAVMGGGIAYDLGDHSQQRQEVRGRARMLKGEMLEKGPEVTYFRMALSRRGRGGREEKGKERKGKERRATRLVEGERGEGKERRKRHRISGRKGGG